MTGFDTGAVELTEQERRLLNRIELDALSLKHENARQNGDLACELMKSLLLRNAIPEVRMEYFSIPQFNVGGHGSSRMAIFERNGTRGDDIFKHPHFLKYLSYFIYGARLPDRVIRDFCHEVQKCGQVTSGDIAPLGKFAKRQTRSEQLDPGTAAEEFYKLALDCRLSESTARSIRDDVKRVRRGR
jgi:hypothetical protein